MRRSSSAMTASVMPLVLLLAVAALPITGCSHAPNPLIGAWEVVQPGVGAPEPDSSSGMMPNPLVPMKILTDSYFAFGYLTPSGEVFAGGGTYTYDGRDHYTEFIRYHSLPYLVGMRIDFTCRLEGDLWYHDGTYVTQGVNGEIHEVWRRLDEGKPSTPDTTRVKWRKQPSDLKTTRARTGADHSAGT
jgi:hypothetical protein